MKIRTLFMAGIVIGLILSISFCFIFHFSQPKDIPKQKELLDTPKFMKNGEWWDIVKEEYVGQR